jgi:hypothetical protein
MHDFPPLVPDMAGLDLSAYTTSAPKQAADGA